MSSTKQVGIYKATYDRRIADTPQGKYNPSCCRIAAQEDGLRFDSTLENALATGKLLAEEDGENTILISEAVLLEIQDWLKNPKPQ